MKDRILAIKIALINKIEKCDFLILLVKYLKFPFCEGLIITPTSLISDMHMPPLSTPNRCCILKPFGQWTKGNSQKKSKWKVRDESRI